MSIGSIVNEYENSAFRETYSGLAGISSSFENFLMEENNNITSAGQTTMPYPVGGTGETETETGGASIVPMTQSADESDEVEVTAVAASAAEETDAAEESSAVDVLTTLMATMSGDDDWTYDREALVSDVETFLTALGVDHHDIKELTDMFPPEDGEMSLDQMGKLVTKVGDILAGRVDAGALAGLLSGSGMSEANVQTWLTNMGVEYQRTGELMQDAAEAGEEMSNEVIEENLVANLVNTLPEELSIDDINGLLVSTVGQNAVYTALGALLGDLA